jgi:threonine aldolase
MNIAQTKELCDVAHKHNVPVHLDGARVFNAAAALNVDVKDLVAELDSVQFCLSKGLGAPIGSMLVGPADFIAVWVSAFSPLKQLLKSTRIMACREPVASVRCWEVACVKSESLPRLDCWP